LTIGLTIVVLLIIFSFNILIKGLGFNLGLISVITANIFVVFVAIMPNDMAGHIIFSSCILGGPIASAISLGSGISLSRSANQSTLIFFLGILVGSQFGVDSEEILTNSIGVVLIGISCSILGRYIGIQALRGDQRYRVIHQLSITLTTAYGTKFQYANLTDANFSGACLSSSDFSGACLTRVYWLGARQLEKGKLNLTYLENPVIRKLVISGNGSKQNFKKLNLREVNLKNADLTGANFEGADCSNATLQGADLSDSILAHTQLYGTNLSESCLTGACIEAWKISADTRLKGIRCEYIYTRLPTEEDDNRHRKPDNYGETFQPGDFSDFIAPITKDPTLYMTNNPERDRVGKSSKTLDLIHRKRINPVLAAISIIQLAEENPEAGLELISLEGQERERIRLHALVNSQADCSELYTEYFANYDYMIGLSDVKVQELLIRNAEKADQIQRLEKLLSVISQQPRSYITTNIQQLETMHSNSSGISQTVNGGTIHGGLQAFQGNNNQSIMETVTTAEIDEKQLTQSEVIQLLEQISVLIQQAELPADIKEESTLYLGAAKKATEKEEPKKVLAADNLKSMAETLQTASKTVESSKSLWENMKPILSQLPTWLGVTKGFFGL
jgi:uncharacterized protein YjbI with pentapeptide repeats